MKAEAAQEDVPPKGRSYTFQISAQPSSLRFRPSRSGRSAHNSPHFLRFGLQPKKYKKPACIANAQALLGMHGGTAVKYPRT